MPLKYTIDLLNIRTVKNFLGTGLFRYKSKNYFEPAAGYVRKLLIVVETYHDVEQHLSLGAKKELDKVSAALLPDVE